MININTDSIEFYLICGLAAVVLGLIGYIHQQLLRKVDGIDKKLDKMDQKIERYEVQNSKEHSFVEQCLAKLGTKVDSMSDRINRIEDEMRYYRREDKSL